MNREQLEKLWETRFHKILELEENSLSFYQDLADRDDLLAANPRLREILEEILNDETQHTTICRELLEIVRSKKNKKQGEEFGAES